MRTGAIFARGSCRALKWLALAGVVFALGAVEAAAQALTITAEDVEVTVSETVTEGGNGTIVVEVMADIAGDTTATTDVTVTIGTLPRDVASDADPRVTNEPSDIVLNTGTATITFPSNDPTTGSDDDLEDVVRSVTIPFGAGQDNDEAEDEIAYITVALSEGVTLDNDALGGPFRVDIEDDETQAIELTEVSPGEATESADPIALTLKPKYAPADDTITVVMTHDGGLDFTLSPSSAQSFSATDQGPIAVTLTGPENDGGRDTTTVTVSLTPDDSSVTAEPLPVVIADAHMLPYVMVEVTDSDGDEAMSLMEGEDYTLTVMLVDDEGEEASSSVEELEVMLSPGAGEADASDFRLQPSSMVTIAMDDSSGELKLLVLDDSDFQLENLVLDALVSGDSDYGPAGPNMPGVVNLPIGGTSPNVTHKTAAEVQAAVDAEIAARDGADDVYTAEDEDLRFEASDFFNLPGAGFDIAIRPDSSEPGVAYTGSDGLHMWVGANENNEPGTTTITVTAIVAPGPNSATVSQNSANSASVAFEVTFHEVPTARPDAPAAPIVVAGGRGELVVSWEMPVTNGSSITGYQVEYWMEGEDRRRRSVEGTATTLAGLADGTEYNVRVRAMSNNGDSPWSDTTTGTTSDAPVLPDLKGLVTGVKLTGGVTTKNIGNVNRYHVTEGETTVKLEVTVQWTNAELSAIYGAGTTALPAELIVQIRGWATSHQTHSLPNWVSWIDEGQDAHFPDAGPVYFDGHSTGLVKVKIPAKPKSSDDPNGVKSATGTTTLLILEDDSEAENDAFYTRVVRSDDVDLRRSTDANLVTRLTVIEDDDEQEVTVKKGTSAGPTMVYENDDTVFTIAATPPRVDLPLEVRLDMLDLSGVTVKAAEISVSDASLTLTPAANSAEVTVHLPASDGNRTDDSYELQASVNLYSLAAGGFDSIAVAKHAITVVDIHKLPWLTVDPPTGIVEEGGQIGLTLKVNRNPANTIATDPETRQYTSEALTIAVMAGGDASSSDFTMTPSSISVDEYKHTAAKNWMQEVTVTIAASVDEDIDAETLMLDFVVNGTKAENGPRPDGDMNSVAQANLTIQDATATLVSVRENAYDVIKGALGDPPMLTTGMSAELMGVNLFDYDSAAVSVAYATSVEGGAVTASAGGGTVTIMGAMAGEAKVTITATATPMASSLVVDQTKANVAQMTFPVMVEDEDLVFMVAGPEDMNLSEGGMGGMVTVTTNRPVTENTEVMLMRDGASSADDADYELQPPLVTIMAGQMEGATMVMALEDSMAEDMEMLTLFLVVDGMQMTDKSVSFYLWDTAVPALPIIAQLLLAAFLALGGYRRYRRR